MAYCSCYNIEPLPDLTVYGGSSEVISVLPKKPDGQYMTVEEADACSTKLTLARLSVLSGLGNNGTPVPPVLSKTGSVEVDDDGYPNFVFQMVSSDTLKLRGKYIYQIEIKSAASGGTTPQIFQGTMYIRYNTDQQG